MNLTQLFNWDFFVQNVKKSKASIIFIMLLLPAFTALTFVSSSATSPYVVHFYEMGIFNIIFMYIVPIALSISLFDFCFKKTSCDFIGSMPVSRNAIFVTNTLGGIALLLLTQVVTALLIFLFSFMTPNLTIFGAMILDVFIYFSIAYIFVFAACNLAITISGNKFAAIATTMLILFLVPFTIACSRYKGMIDGNSNHYFDYETMNYRYFVSYNFTAPSRIFDFESLEVGGYGYDGISLLKMAGLSIVYIAGGYYLFKRKKYEMAGESFENDKIHLVVKALTLSPFVAVLALVGIENMDAFVLFYFAIIAVYYYLFDMITNKKIKISITIVSLIVSFLVMYGFYDLIVPKLSLIGERQFNIADVETATIENIKYSYNVLNDFNLVIDDKEIISNLLSSESDMYSSFPYYEYNYYANGFVKTNDGKTHPVKIGYVSNNAIIKKYGDNIYKIKDDSGKVVLNGLYVSKENEKLIKENIRKDIDGITYKEYMDILLKNDRDGYELQMVSYKNHKLITRDFSSSGLKETSKFAIKLSNQMAAKWNVFYWNMFSQNDFAKYIIANNPQISFYDDYMYDELEEYANEELYEDLLDEYLEESGDYNEYSKEYIEESDYDMSTYDIIYSGLRAISPTQMREYILQHKDDEFDRTKPYFVLNGMERDVMFFSNDIEGFYRLFAKSYNENRSQNSGIILNEI